MNITYDKHADAMVITLAKAEVEETKDIAPGVYADYDADGRVISLEILGASRKYDFDGSKIEPPNPYMPLSDAGEMYGLSPTTLRHQIVRGVLPGRKFGRNWMVRHDHMATYFRDRSRKSSKSRIEPQNPYMPLSAAGEMYGLSPETLRYQIDKGSLQGRKIGHNWMVRHDHMATYFRDRSRKSSKFRVAR